MLKGNAGQGRTVFEGTAQCTKCHALPGQASGFGPDLKDIRRKYNRSQLLTQILRPSEIIAPEFKLTTITTKDQRELTGFIVRRTETGVVLREQTLAEHPLNKSEIADQQESSLSAMPEGLLAPLTAEEAADLLEFLLE
jgi:putative heme-binding domain-containing protein